MDYLKKNIVVIGLGYVGLPLAVKLSSAFDVIGYDILDQRINELKKYYDNTNEITKVKLQKAKRLMVSSNIEDIQNKNIYIITVPTPVNKDNLPDLKLLKKACKLVGKIMAKNSIVIFESTVYPGVTKNICAPIIARYSGCELNKNFFLGYSPERINPGDKKHSVEKITKVVSGSNSATVSIIGNIYKKIIKAGVYHASSIEVAETAKAIENAQRDINIAFINEVTMIFQCMGIDTGDVLEAARTKWNFLDFKPGLVGGHCIGVDPYYLSYKSEMLGYYPEVVLAGRRINEKMVKWIIEQLILEMCKRKISIFDSEILILGLSFKKNCPDLRNSKIINLIKGLGSYGGRLTIVDPVIDKIEAKDKLNLNVIDNIPNEKKFSTVIMAVDHNSFVNLNIVTWKSLFDNNCIILDLTGIIPREFNPIRL